jgi:hypothetical protein
MTDIYLLSEGKQQGPHTADEIQQALAWGFIPSDLLALKQWVTDWVQVGTLMGLPEGSKPWNIHQLKNEVQI